MKPADPLFYTVIPTDIGTLYVAATDRGLCRLTFEATEDEFTDEVRVWYGREVIHAPDRLRDAEQQVEHYFRGERRAFDLAFDFLDGTPFHQRVWRTLLTIPYGQVRSYKWVAERVGTPLGARAVGQANSRNPIPILVPCHRVINHDGRIGGYGDRLDIKAYLLRLESQVSGLSGLKSNSALRLGTWDLGPGTCTLRLATKHRR